MRYKHWRVASIPCGVFPKIRGIKALIRHCINHVTFCPTFFFRITRNIEPCKFKVIFLRRFRWCCAKWNNMTKLGGTHRNYANVNPVLEGYNHQNPDCTVAIIGDQRKGTYLVKKLYGERVRISYDHPKSTPLQLQNKTEEKPTNEQVKMNSEYMLLACSLLAPMKINHQKTGV